MENLGKGIAVGLGFISAAIVCSAIAIKNPEHVLSAVFICFCSIAVLGIVIFVDP